MYRILDPHKLDASIRSFMDKKAEKFSDLPTVPHMAKDGIKSRLAHSKKLMQDCLGEGYILSGDTSFAS